MIPLAHVLSFHVICVCVAAHFLCQNVLSRAQACLLLWPCYSVQATGHMCNKGSNRLTYTGSKTGFSIWQEAQKDAVSAFDDFMDQCMETDWARDRDKLVKTIMPVGGLGKSQPSRAAPLTSSSNTLFLEAANGQLTLRYHHVCYCLSVVAGSTATCLSTTACSCAPCSCLPWSCPLPSPFLPLQHLANTWLGLCMLQHMRSSHMQARHIAGEGLLHVRSGHDSTSKIPPDPPLVSI